jgi:cytoskeletal protein CcmA (bactofilin family)
MQNDHPNMVIGPKNKMKGDIKFEGLLRVEGNIEGSIIAPIEVRFLCECCDSICSRY